MDKMVRDLRFYGFATVFSAIVTVQSFRYDYASSQFPRFLSLCMLTLSLASFAGLLSRRKNAGNTAATPVETESFMQMVKTPLAVFCLTLAYVAGIVFLGYFSASTLFFLGSMFYFGQRRLLIMALSTVVFLGVAYLLFVHFLGLRLPQGLLW